MGIFRQFPYSNFHEMNMDEIIKMVRELADDWLAYQEKWGQLYDDTAQALADFKAYVQEYWDTLDLTAEVNTVLSSMLNAGAFDPIILTQLTPVVTSWLENNITTPTGVVIDSSLSIAGACADAKATGDADRKLYNILGRFNVIDMVPYMQHNNATYNGITWEWVDDTTVHANGTATSATGINLFTSTNTLPPFMKAGGQYRIILEPPQTTGKVYLEIFNYSGGSTTLIKQIFSSQDVVYIPANVTGLIIRLRVNAGDVISHNTTIHILNMYESELGKYANMYKGVITASTPYANPDLNDFIGNDTYVVDSNGVTNAPLSAGTGILICAGSSAICIQLFTYSTGLQYVRYINTNSGTYTDWKNIPGLDPLNRMERSALTVGNLNDFVETGYVFVSSPNTIQNLPESGAGFLWVYKFTSTGIVYQEYTSFNSMKNYRRKLFAGNWGSWVEGGSGSGGNIQNTYNINTSPVIEASTDNWLYPVNGDNTGAIMSMLNSTGICRLAEGVFNVSGNIDMPANSAIIGCGKNTILKLNDNISTGYVIKINTNNVVENLTIRGANSAPTFEETTNRMGIYFNEHNAPKHNCINDVFIENFTGSGIYCNNTGGGIEENILATNVCIDSCKVGININYWSEYHKFTNCVMYNCDTACINNGGNNVFVSCSFHGNTGFVIDNSNGNLNNPGHGSCIGCTFNHIGGNTGKAIVIKGNAVTFTFSGCQNWYGSLDIQNSKGIIFGDCAFGGNPVFNIVNNTSILFSNCIFYVVPTITNTGNTSFIMSNCYHSADGLQILP